jgi:exosortase A
MWQSSLLALLISCFVLGATFWQTFAGLASIWKYGTYSHGYLVLPICLFLVWQRRELLMSMTPAPTLWPVLLMTILATTWLIGELAEANLIRQFAVVAMIPVMVWMVVGSKIARSLLFPLCFIFFAVPVGESLIPRLQDFTAWFTVSGLQLTGIPAVLEGRTIYVSSGIWEVAAECSGLRYLISSIALGTLFSYLIYRSWWKKLTFVAASILVPILANGIRAYSIVLLAHKVDRRLAVGIDHLIYGWIFFAFVMLLLLLVGFIWHDAHVSQRPLLSPSTSENNDPAQARPHLRSLLAVFGSVCVICVISSIAAHALLRPAPRAFTRGGDLQVSGHWSLTPLRQDPFWTSRNADVERAMAFSDGTHSIRLYVSYYAYQRPRAELMNAQSIAQDVPGWNDLGERVRRVQLPSAQFDVNEKILAGGSRKRIIWSWYWVDGVFTSSSGTAKLLRAKARLLRERQDAAEITLIGDLDAPSDSPEALRDFLGHAETVKLLNSFSDQPRLFLK